LSSKFSSSVFDRRLAPSPRKIDWRAGSEKRPYVERVLPGIGRWVIPDPSGSLPSGGGLPKSWLV
jgi:hypothetical protein